MPIYVTYMFVRGTNSFLIQKPHFPKKVVSCEIMSNIKPYMSSTSTMYVCVQTHPTEDWNKSVLINLSTSPL